MDGMWFKAQMAAHGLNQEKVAAKLGIDRSVVSKILNGKVNLETRHAPLLAELFKSTTEEILQHAGVLPSQSSPNPALNTPHNLGDNPAYPNSNVRGQMLEVPRDTDWHKREMVKVMGTGQGGDGSGFFEWNGDVIDRVRRPPKLAGRQKVFAIYLRTASKSSNSTRPKRSLSRKQISGTPTWSWRWRSCSDEAAFSCHCHGDHWLCGSSKHGDEI